MAGSACGEEDKTFCPKGQQLPIPPPTRSTSDLDVDDADDCFGIDKKVRAFAVAVASVAQAFHHPDGFDIARRVKDLRSLCDYWSLQGAARHVIAAFEIALQDAKGKSLGVPVYDLLGGAKAASIKIYGSGGCCDAKEQFLREMGLLDSLGITIYKIRSVKRDVLRTAWAMNEADHTRRCIRARFQQIIAITAHYVLRNLSLPCIIEPSGRQRVA